jgi:hypothetical protein
MSDIQKNMEAARLIADQIMSPEVQWINWIVLVAIVAFSGLIHALIAWTKKSGEIKAVTERLDEVVEQNKRITEVQEKIRQQMADSIWKDQKRWEMEAALYKDYLVSMGKRRKLCMEMKRVDPESDEFDELLHRDANLQEEQGALFQQARLLMPADRFEVLKAVLLSNANNPLFNAPPENSQQWNQMMDTHIEMYAKAENALAAHARERLGTNSDAAVGS